MSIKLKALGLIFGCVCAFNALAVSQENITVTFVGSQAVGTNATMTYVLLNTNPYNCLYSGVYFTDEALRKDAIIVALAAKALNRVVRIDYTGGSGAMCIGSGIYSQ
jgi:hypothetical protein